MATYEDWPDLPCLLRARCFFGGQQESRADALWPRKGAGR